MELKHLVEKLLSRSDTYKQINFFADDLEEFKLWRETSQAPQSWSLADINSDNDVRWFVVQVGFIQVLVWLHAGLGIASVRREKETVVTASLDIPFLANRTVAFLIRAMEKAGEVKERMIKKEFAMLDGIDNNRCFSLQFVTSESKFRVYHDGLVGWLKIKLLQQVHEKQGITEPKTKTASNVIEVALNQPAPLPPPVILKDQLKKVQEWYAKCWDVTPEQIHVMIEMTYRQAGWPEVRFDMQFSVLASQIATQEQQEALVKQNPALVNSNTLNFDAIFLRTARTSSFDTVDEAIEQALSGMLVVKTLTPSGALGSWDSIKVRIDAEPKGAA